MAGCCAGSTEVAKRPLGDDFEYEYSLFFDVNAVASSNADVVFKDCGCVKLLNSSAKLLAEFEPVLCWKNKATGSIYQPESLEKALAAGGVKSFNAELLSDVDELEPEVIRFTEEELSLLFEGDALVKNGSIYSLEEDYDDEIDLNPPRPFAE